MTAPDSIETSTLTQLRQAATEAAQHAYTPYSSFRVGAALLLDNGDIVSELSHAEVMDAGERVSARLTQLLTQLPPKLSALQE